MMDSLDPFASGRGIQNQNDQLLYAPAPMSIIIVIIILYVQEVVTLQKKYLIYLHQKMMFTPFINYYDTLG